ncbi:MAG: HK97 gp10 family phage protein [Bifidobacterium crudilactis]|nr:HK97 gp10 family phage protein [Bifidobacterium crudilactis]
MPRAGQTQVDFNDAFFSNILRSAGVKSLCMQKAEKVLEAAKASAPVGDPDNPVYTRPERHQGQNRDGLQIETVSHAHRDTVLVVGTDAKTMLVESKTGNLARALKAAK